MTTIQSLRYSQVLFALSVLTALVFGFIIKDSHIYHWGVCLVLGLCSAALALKAKSIPWVVLGLLSAALPPILMFGSWAAYTYSNI